MMLMSAPAVHEDALQGAGNLCECVDLLRPYFCNIPWGGEGASLPGPGRPPQLPHQTREQQGGLHMWSCVVDVARHLVGVRIERDQAATLSQASLKVSRA